MKRKKASLNYDTEHCKNCTIQRVAFKGTTTTFAEKELNVVVKNFKDKIQLYCRKKRQISPFSQAVKGLGSQA
jgi:hypothetical protein